MPHDQVTENPSLTSVEAGLHFRSQGCDSLTRRRWIGDRLRRDRRPACQPWLSSKDGGLFRVLRW